MNTKTDSELAPIFSPDITLRQVVEALKAKRKTFYQIVVALKANQGTHSAIAIVHGEKETADFLERTAEMQADWTLGDGPKEIDQAKLKEDISTRLLELSLRLKYVRDHQSSAITASLQVAIDQTLAGLCYLDDALKSAPDNPTTRATVQALRVL